MTSTPVKTGVSPSVDATPPRRIGVIPTLGVPVYGGDPLRATPPTSAPSTPISTATINHPLAQSITPTFSIPLNTSVTQSLPASSFSTTPPKTNLPSAKQPTNPGIPAASGNPPKASAPLKNPGQAANTPISISTGPVNLERKAVVADAKENIEGLQSLMKIHAWKDALNLARTLHSKTESPVDKLQFKLSIVVCLAKSREYLQALAEIDQLGANLDDRIYRYEHYPQLYNTKTGSMIPFSIKVIQAELRSLLKTDGCIEESIDMLYSILNQCKLEVKKYESAAAKDTSQPESLAHHDDPVLNNNLEALVSDSSIEENILALTKKDSSQEIDLYRLWRSREIRVTLSIATRFLLKQSFLAAVELLQSVANRYPTDPHLISALGRTVLQMGDVKAATILFRRAESLIDNVEKSVLVHMNRGFLELANDAFDQAIRHFQAVIDIDPFNVSAVNNQSICFLYTCDLARAISSLESLIQKDPVNNLNETLAFNLCTLYDLASDKSIEKKQQLLDLIHRYHGEDSFDTSVLKLPSADQK